MLLLKVVNHQPPPPKFFYSPLKLASRALFLASYHATHVAPSKYIEGATWAMGGGFTGNGRPLSASTRRFSASTTDDNKCRHGAGCAGGGEVVAAGSLLVPASRQGARSCLRPLCPPLRSLLSYCLLPFVVQHLVPPTEAAGGAF